VAAVGGPHTARAQPWLHADALPSGGAALLHYLGDVPDPTEVAIARDVRVLLLSITYAIRVCVWHGLN
jgi:hypothetical protein